MVIYEVKACFDVFSFYFLSLFFWFKGEMALREDMICLLYPIFVLLAAMCHVHWQYTYIIIDLYTSFLLWKSYLVHRAD